MSQIVLVETSGNQGYLFATNKLKENVGASELTWRAGTRWILEAIKEQGGPELKADDPGKLRESLKSSTAKDGIEVVIATSGKALFVVDEREKGKAIVAAVTHRAFEEAPGLDFAGAIVTYNSNTDCIHRRIKEVHQRLNSLRGQRPLPASRFLHLPVVASCASSGLPAEEIKKDSDGIPRALSRFVLKKRDAANLWRNRLDRILRRHRRDGEADVWLPQDLDKMEREFQGMDWVAVVHADGNGMGQTFLDFDKHSGHTAPQHNSAYIEALRCFSAELDDATETAFVRACGVLPTKKGKVGGRERDIRPIVPLVLGGDDLTVLVDGRHAMAFTKAFLEAFEKETARRTPLSTIAERAIGRSRFGACAGVAIVKPHFPFHTSYELSESLLRSAKRVKLKRHLGPHGSALDFHILFDASFTSLTAIREKLKIERASLTAGPYVISRQEDLTSDWARAHDMQGLLERVRAIEDVDPDTGRRRLPNSQLHALRDSLFRGQEIADTRLRELFQRYKDPCAKGRKGIGALCEGSGPPTLFREGLDGGTETRFLDALTSAAFWEGENTDTATREGGGND